MLQDSNGYTTYLQYRAESVHRNSSSCPRHGLLPPTKIILSYKERPESSSPSGSPEEYTKYNPQIRVNTPKMIHVSLGLLTPRLSPVPSVDNLSSTKARAAPGLEAAKAAKDAPEAANLGKLSVDCFSAEHTNRLILRAGRPLTEATREVEVAATFFRSGQVVGAVHKDAAETAAISSNSNPLED